MVIAVKEARQVQREEFWVIVNRYKKLIVGHPHLNSTAKLVGLWYMEFANYQEYNRSGILKGWVGIERLKEEMHLSDDQLKAAFKALNDNHILITLHRGRGEGDTSQRMFDRENLDLLAPKKESEPNKTEAQDQDRSPYRQGDLPPEDTNRSVKEFTDLPPDRRENSPIYRRENSLRLKDLNQQNKNNQPKTLSRERRWSLGQETKDQGGWVYEKQKGEKKEEGEVQ